MILFGIDGMKAANNSIGSDAYREGWEKLFKKNEPQPNINKSKNSTEEVEKEEEDVLL